MNYSVSERFAQFNTALFAMQVEITSMTDRATSGRLNAMLFAVQTAFVQLFHETFTASNASNLSIEDKPMLATTENTASIQFSEKEIIKMPKQFRKIFRAGEVKAHVRQKPNGVYEIRCMIDGRNYAASAKLLETAKEKFIKCLAERSAPVCKPTGDTSFKGYLFKWLEDVKKPFVKASTLKSYYDIFNAQLKEFSDMKLSDVSHAVIQKKISSLTTDEKFRQAKAVYQLLKQLFDYAVADEALPRSPMATISLMAYDQQKGISLTHAEEARFVHRCLSSIDDNPYAQAFLLILYTGIRRAELSSVKVEGNWIHVITAKGRKGKKEKPRAIPISSMLEPHMAKISITEVVKLKPDMLTRHLKEFSADRTVKDLRHTFITRAQECGIPREFVSLWAGHAPDSSVTSKTYTHLEQNLEIQISAMKKFKYDLI